KKYGFERVRVFGYSLGCRVGIQAGLNLIVYPLQDGEAALFDLYEFQWQLHYILGWSVRVFTEPRLREYCMAKASEVHVDKIFGSAVDLISIYHFGCIKRIFDLGDYYDLLMKGDRKPICRADIDPGDIELKNIETITSAFPREEFLLRRQYLAGLLEQQEVKELIQKKSASYANGLLEHINKFPFSAKDIILRHLREVMALNEELDQFYEQHLEEIQKIGAKVSRFYFRSSMREKQDILPPVARDSDLAKRAKKHWDNDAVLVKDLERGYGQEIVILFSILYFLLDEVRNSGITELLYDETQFQQLVHCIYVDFCKRFVDPFEEVSLVTFTEPVVIDLLKSQTLSGVHMTSICRSGFYMISFDRPVCLPQLANSQEPVQHDYIRIPFYSEVIEGLPSSFLPGSILGCNIDVKVRSNVLNFCYGRKICPRDNKKFDKLKMTVERLFLYQDNWEYRGKISRFSCQAKTFEYPPVQDFDLLLAKNGMDKKDYPDYEKDKKVFNEFQLVKDCTQKISYYEMQIITLEDYKLKRQQVALTLTSDHNAFWLNQEYVRELEAKIELLRQLQQQHIRHLFDCPYILAHSCRHTSDFKERLAHELVEDVYRQINNSSSKDRLHKVVVACFDSTLKMSEDAATDGSVASPAELMAARARRDSSALYRRQSSSSLSEADVNAPHSDTSGFGAATR
ncbi:MAG: hypothetical protein KAT71_03105, partial [Gammaproteobacteria bacterium]|nr:hypothetical protein [Gammaproteobacteria bacterium]